MRWALLAVLLMSAPALSLPGHAPTDLAADAASSSGPAGLSPVGAAETPPATTHASAVAPAAARPSAGAPSYTDDHKDHILVTAAPAPQPLAMPERGIQFVCPEPEGSLGLPALPLLGGEDPVVYGCPIRVYDTGYSFGSPKIVVRDDDHREAAFFSLHGAPAGGFSGEDRPSDQSRTGRTHTAFTTDAQGLRWQDQPTDFGYGGIGEEAAGTIDSNGNLYAAYLWTNRYQDAWESTIELFKGPTAKETGGMIDAYEDPFRIMPLDEGNRFRRVHAVDLPAHVTAGNGTETAAMPAGSTTGNGTGNQTGNQTGNGTAPPPSDDNATGEIADPDANVTDERVVVTWLEEAYDWTTSSTGMSSWIRLAHSDIGGKNNWTVWNATQVVGPCKDASSPVAYEGKVYIACTVERGYDHRHTARVGDVDIWEIDVHADTARLVDKTGVTGGRPLLAANDDGRMVVLAYIDNLDADGAFDSIAIEAAFGWYGEHWEAPGGNLGPTLRAIGGGPNTPVLDADVTALALTDDATTGTPTAFLVYKEWHDDPQEAEGVDPDDPAAFISNTLTDYNKFAIAFTACQFPLAGAKMELGTGVDSNNAQAYMENPAVFNDLDDGLYATKDVNGADLVYFAVNDYGAMQFGAMVPPIDVNNVCVALPPLPPPPVPPVPQALSIINPYTTAIGAAVAIPAAAMVLYLLTIKRRAPHSVAVEDR